MLVSILLFLCIVFATGLWSAVTLYRESVETLESLDELNEKLLKDANDAKTHNDVLNTVKIHYNEYEKISQSRDKTK